MDFNSNDEYLKAFPPNFGPKIEHPNKERLFDLEAHGLPPKDPEENVEAKPVEVPEPVHLDDELECGEVHEPIQVDAENADNNSDLLLKEQEEILILDEDHEPEIDEPMPQMVDMALLREDEMVLDEGDGGGVQTMLSLEAIEESVLDAEALGGIEAKEPPSAVESIEEKTEAIRYVETKEPDNHHEAEKSLIAEGFTEEAAMEDEIFGPPTSKESVESTRGVTDFERPLTDTVKDSAMDTNALNFAEYEQPAIEIEVIESTLITAETSDQIEFVESALKTLEEASENAGAIGQIEIKEPVTLEVTEKTTIRTIPLTETKVEADSDVGTVDPPMALEIIDKTTIKAKAICQDDEMEPRFMVKFTESTSTSITGFDKELGTCSDAEVERIVDSIMNDIAGIEADIEANNEDVGLEAGIESNTQHQKVAHIYEKPVGIESEGTCQDHVEPSGGHV